MNKTQQRAQIVNNELKRLYPNTQTILKFSNHWELVVAVALSAQCTDKQVNKVTDKLFKKYPKLEDYLTANPEEFEQDIYATGFYKNKAKNVLAAAQVVYNDFNGEIPQTIKELMTIPGVGRKTANVVLGNAFGIIDGIAVDTHVKRISQKYKLTKNTSPEKIEKDLMKILPKEDWFNFTNRVIDYGREYCPARNHNHEECPLYIALKKENLL